MKIFITLKNNLQCPYCRAIHRAMRSIIHAYDRATRWRHTLRRRAITNSITQRAMYSTRNLGLLPGN